MKPILTILRQGLAPFAAALVLLGQAGTEAQVSGGGVLF